ncbi:type VI secretion system amidase effector protein Tae4 [Longimicrobium sp.]|uniref:type VI secretion system amidase effector protein Tae4 n=1 Tax=Longimicrobium sp. TaxID=2029185 RepID=UPI003B3B0F49
MITFDSLWASHPNLPNVTYPCTDKDGKIVPGLENQCAMRMGICLQKAGMDLSSYPGKRCSDYPALKHKPAHILVAQQLADWLKIKLGKSRFTRFKKPDPYAQLKKATKGKKGIVFFMNFYGAGGDHIDLWNGGKAISDFQNYVDSTEIWFWEIK